MNTERDYALDTKKQTEHSVNEKWKQTQFALAAACVLLTVTCGLYYVKCDLISSNLADLWPAVQSMRRAPFDLESFLHYPPAFCEEATEEINGNIPLFTKEEIQNIRIVNYSELDELGRCGPAAALLGPETIPTENRSPIGMVKPSGWHTVRYDDLIEDKYLYNRCHLIGYQLAGENADPRNLITGTRFMNMSGMLPFENRIYAYIIASGNHVLYRVTPVFLNDNLLASGVLMEAWSVEDGGKGLRFCVYVHNVQPGIEIDYLTGESYAKEENARVTTETILPLTGEGNLQAYNTAPADTEAPEITYILNINTKRFHVLSCPSVQETKEKNRENFYGTREEAIEKGYKPCGRCSP